MQTPFEIKNALPERLPVLKIKMSRGLLNVLLTIYGFVTLYPLVWLFLSAFKSNPEFYEFPFGLPKEWHLENFADAWNVARMGVSFKNSFIVTIAALILTLVFGAMAAFVLSRFKFRGRAAVMGLFLLGMLIPIHSTLVPLFIMMKKIHLLDTYGALIFPYTAFELSLAIFVTIAYMSSIPKEMEEAALIDEPADWGFFFRVMLPLSAPALATVGILAFLRFWNDFAFALVFISKPALQTLPLSLSMFATGYMTDYRLTFAALTLAVIPTIVVYLLFQEQVMKGMVAGAVKG
ncbi:carbohydrate ABC transporter permease [Paenibacillus sp. D2_2]|uniref:carbohydrate ABC transporter permease n=1 Tax=Paenibacillus sp. D2_2 TaxID=3073092 RepID=UPI0028162A4B|nr:carbohydrate ABC transporter permease [Paenibacillus sp. D2_2]WMT40765.1 carbohydrate ABC transporter permease [Paenibacillus sp. D2_2]